MRRRVPSGSALLLLTVSLAACGSGSGGASPSSAGSSAPASSTSSPVVATTSVVPVAGTTPALPAKPVVILEPDGLGVLVGGSSIRQFPFGTDVAVLRTVATTALGPLTTTTQSECGQGPRVQLAQQGFSMLLDGTKFVGWFDSGRSKPRLTTADGLGVGSTLAQVKASVTGVTVTTDTLGPEWTTDGGLGGLLDGTAPASKVTGMYAGETCFFR